MESSDAADTLSALAHEGRLAVFRLLVKAGKQGLAAGDIARAVEAPPSSLSANLNVLSHAGLVRARRDGRSIIYTADYGRMTAVIAFLIEDCCNGMPEVCAPLAETTARLACCA
jgi:DNA-binding transcriptional ArsR family regulator